MEGRRSRIVDTGQCDVEACIVTDIIPLGSVF